MEILHNGSKVFYERTGNGEKSLLLFHGFGQDHRVFTSLTKSLSTNYRCFSFDLLFHGRSHWPHYDTPLSKKDWCIIIEKFMVQEDVQAFSLLGYSIGARLVLATAEGFPSKTREVYLIAPDGINANVWFTLATGNPITRALFRTLMKNPGLFTNLTTIAKTLGLLHPKVLRFVQSQTSRDEQRSRVYLTWTTIRNISFNLQELTSLLNTYHVEVTLVLGKNDLLMKERSFKKFMGNLNQPRVILLNSGHLSLLKHLKDIVRL